MIRRLLLSAVMVAVTVGLTAPAVSASSSSNPGTVRKCYPGGLGDLRLTGALNRADNASAYGSYDGSCSGSLQFLYTVVTAGSWTQADAKCEALGREYANNSLAFYGYSVGQNWWVCYGRATVT